MLTTQIQPAREITMSTSPERRNSTTSTTITQAVAQAMQNASDTTTVVDTTSAISEQQELQNLRQIIITWRELEAEVSTLSAQVREKNKRKKALEEMILRIMKKYNIGALDLTGSGGRLLLRRQTSKGTLNPKTLADLLSKHLKSETAAADALKFITEHRETKVRESLLYERE
jgi:uncharacterized protein